MTMRTKAIGWMFVLAAAATPARAQQSAAELLSGLGETDDAGFRQRLDALVELGQEAGVAVPKLRELAGDDGLPLARFMAVVDALAELAPFRAAGIDVDQAPLSSRQIQFAMQMERDSKVSGQMGRAFLRLRMRSEFPRDCDLATLVDAAGARNPLRVEVAVDLLGARGPAARAALPALQALLERPEPRLLGTDATLPLHRKIARAVAAIAPDSDVAALAQRAIAHPPTRVTREAPPRLRERITALLRELDDPATRERAAANLAALGRAAALPVAATLRKDRDPDYLTAALAVLRDLGPAAGDAVPALFEALTTLTTAHTIAVFDALTATAPYCTDVLPPLTMSYSVQSLEISGRSIAGPIGAEFLTAFAETSKRYYPTITVDPDATSTELAKALAGNGIRQRETALAILRRRGPKARDLLPALAAMLHAEQPRDHRTIWNNAQGTTNEAVDRSDEIQCLAAEAILAIGRADDPEVAAAKARLAR
ncbi:MAG: hypothetical protein U1E73_11495 [Planctomycetota bacterium]